jgi:hypothetical protein
MHELDKRENQKMIDAIIFGNNRKRKRGEVEGLDVDENSKRKMRRLEERGQMLRMQGEGEDDEGFGIFGQAHRN